MSLGGHIERCDVQSRLKVDDIAVFAFQEHINRISFSARSVSLNAEPGESEST
jgi:hypothetical protein